MAMLEAILLHWVKAAGTYQNLQSVQNSQENNYNSTFATTGSL